MTGSTENLALWYRAFGRPADVLALETGRLDAPADGVVRIRMKAAPVNPSDLVPITGAYRHRLLPPRVGGYEGVGTVVAGDGAGDLAGRRVLALRGAGTWQSYVDCDPRWVVPVPDDVDDAVAARAYINPLAARLMLMRWPAAGRRVLLTAAGSACANFLAQWAFDAGAREVAGVYRSPTHAASLSALGVVPIPLGAGDDVARAARRADLVFEAVGGALATRILAAMRPDADFISYGLLSGEPFATGGAARPQRFHLRDRLDSAGPAEWQGWFETLWPLLKRAALPRAHPFPVRAWRDALALFDVPGRRSTPLLVMA